MNRDPRHKVTEQLRPKPRETRKRKDADAPFVGPRKLDESYPVNARPDGYYGQG